MILFFTLFFVLCTHISYKAIQHLADSHHARKKLRMHTNMIVLHLGGVHGSDKQKTWEEEGHWQGEFSLIDKTSSLSTRDHSWSGDLVFLRSEASGWLLCILSGVIVLSVFVSWKRHSHRNRHPIIPLTTSSSLKSSLSSK